MMKTIIIFGVLLHCLALSAFSMVFGSDNVVNLGGDVK